MPPFTGVGVNVTEVPEQIFVALAEILALGGTVGLTVIEMLFEVAVVGDAQLAVEVIMQLTTSPFAREDVLKVPPVPAFDPLRTHW